MSVDGSDELAPFERSELEALRDIHEASLDRNLRSKWGIVAAASFATAASVAMIAIGGGGLGVAFAVSMVTGIYALVRSQ